MTGGTIIIYHYTYDGADCSPAYAETIAHEMGHVLGLADAPSCTGYMMGPAQSQHRTDGTLEIYPSRSVKAAECWAANKQWLYGDEEAPPEPSNLEPILDQGGGCWECTRESPIVIQLDEGRCGASAPADPVHFDIDGDGLIDTITWLSREHRQAFLARNLNQNGAIDSGRELFGNVTRLQSGEIAQHGFEALAEYDANDNGAIDPGDPAWDELDLWFDENHDGVTDTGELVPLRASPIREISLSYRAINRRDLHGNLFRYRSTVRLMNEAGVIVSRPIYDVFFIRVFE